MCCVCVQYTPIQMQENQIRRHLTLDPGICWFPWPYFACCVCFVNNRKIAIPKLRVLFIIWMIQPCWKKKKKKNCFPPSGYMLIILRLVQHFCQYWYMLTTIGSMPLKFLTDIHGPQYMNHIVALDFSSNATKASTYSVKYVNKI